MSSNTTSPKKHTLGILKDKSTDEVPGTVLLLSDHANEPLGLPNSGEFERKKTSDGIILDPQPDNHPDDPLNWSSWRRDAALLSLGWHCLVGGGMTPVLAAGFTQVADTFDVTEPAVALTTGLYMLGLGIGCVLVSPTAIVFGKRPVYLAGVVLFLVASIWCAASQNYASLVVARIVMGIGVASCEALPSATIAEIFFLHERAYRVGIYTLLLLGGKNLVPLVSAVVINSLGWRWVFWIVAIIVGFNLGLLFFFVPETFWSRTPHRKPKSNRPSFIRQVSGSIFSKAHSHAHSKKHGDTVKHPEPAAAANGYPSPSTASFKREERDHSDGRHAHFITESSSSSDDEKPIQTADQPAVAPPVEVPEIREPEKHDEDDKEIETAREVYSKLHETTSRESLDRYVKEQAITPIERPQGHSDPEKRAVDHSAAPSVAYHGESQHSHHVTGKTFVQQLKLYNGKLQNVSWRRACVRPFILFAYPAVLWSAFTYSLSIGWLIVLSESVAHIYQKQPYNFTPLQTGLVYLSPFIGGVLGTAVAGKVSDVVVRYMTRRNGGIYEPEFRLMMAGPVAISTAIGLMGYGWAAQEKDNWIVPTVFFGIISFGCSLGSTTAITFVVDSYRQFAGEALVTLNFSKNVFHGFVFSLFFNRWLEADGSKAVFVTLGGLQLLVLIFAVPMYMYGKRMRKWSYSVPWMQR